MNKVLVEKLAVQSLVWVDTGLADGREQVFSTSVFAELIVRECACIADDMKTIETARAIKQHWGVTE
jgi:hypothetical protein